MILEILTFPNPILNEVSEPVLEFNDELRTQVNDMLETMYDAPGVGLAAVQVGIKKRFLVLDVDYESDENDECTVRNKKPRVFINPKVVNLEGEAVFTEGCLSVPGVYEEVKRAAVVEVEYQDIDGHPQKIRVGETEDEILLSVCLQHEIDHLEGRLFLERLGPMKRKMTKKRLLKEMKVL